MLLSVVADRIHFSRLAISRTSGCSGNSTNSLHLEEMLGCAFLPHAVVFLSLPPSVSFSARPDRPGCEGGGKALGETAFLRRPGRRWGSRFFRYCTLLRFRRRRRCAWVSARPGARLHVSCRSGIAGGGQDAQKRSYEGGKITKQRKYVGCLALICREKNILIFLQVFHETRERMSREVPSRIFRRAGCRDRVSSSIVENLVRKFRTLASHQPANISSFVRRMHRLQPINITT